MTGSSLTQGEQVVAQKRRRTGLPRKSLRCILPVPSRVSRAKSGATSPTRSERRGGGVREGRRVGVPVEARAPRWGADEQPAALIATMPTIVRVRSMRVTMRARILSTFAIISNNDKRCLLKKRPFLECRSSNRKWAGKLSHFQDRKSVV